VSDLEQALEHLGNALSFIADIHPDDRNDAVDQALEFYNAVCPDRQVHPSPFGYQRILDPELTPPPLTDLTKNRKSK
jgi:hypothetical protein